MTFIELLVNFRCAFNTDPFQSFNILVFGWVLCVGRRSISRVLQYAFVGQEPLHHAVFYRFFSRAQWEVDDLSRILLKLAMRFAGDGPVYLLLDDSLCRKSGHHLWGAGMHHDANASSYGRRGGEKKNIISFGHCWVILSIYLPLPWNPIKGMAIPIAFRLYRQRKRCPANDYKKTTELGRELVDMVVGWIENDRKAYVTADHGYACENVVKDQPERVVCVVPMVMDAAVYAPAKRYSGIGRPPKKGERLLSPQELIEAEEIPWQLETVEIYGRQVEALIKTQECLWYRVSETRLGRMIVTRDPNDRIEDRAYYATDESMEPKDMARVFSYRWSEEVMHGNAKQHMGLEDPQNGWWRHEKGQREDTTVPGPKPHETKGEKAVRRTVPFILITYGLVVLWYLEHGHVAEDVARVKQRAPWYSKKKDVFFADMLAALRRHMVANGLFGNPYINKGSTKVQESLLDLLLAA